MDENKKELIIQKCMAISGWVTMRGEMYVHGRDDAFKKAENRIDQIINDLEKLFHDDKV